MTTQTHKTEKKVDRSALIVLLLVGALFGLLGWWFLSTHERVSYTTVTPSKQAKNNRFFAAELLLTELGKEAKTELGRQRLIDLPSARDALVVNEVGKSFNDTRIDAMVAWMQAGGHIITFTEKDIIWRDDDDYQENRLLAHFGISAQDNHAAKGAAQESDSDIGSDIDTDIDTDIDSDTDTEKTDEDELDSNVAVVNLNLGGRRVTAHFDKRVSLLFEPDDSMVDIDLSQVRGYGENATSGNGGSYYPSEYDASDNASDDNASDDDVKAPVHFIDIPVGKGRLSAFSSKDFILNPAMKKRSVDDDEDGTDDANKDAHAEADTSTDADIDMSGGDFIEVLKNALYGGVTNIAQADNAYVLWYITQDANTVWLLPSIDAPSFWQLLWERAGYACLSFVVLTLMWLLWQTGRFGPVMPLIETSRRSILEHLQMVGRFAWRNDRAQHLLAKNRSSTLSSIVSKHPSVKMLQTSELCKKLAELLPLSAQDIYEALYAEAQGERDFIAYSSKLQTLRAYL